MNSETVSPTSLLETVAKLIIRNRTYVGIVLLLSSLGLIALGGNYLVKSFKNDAIKAKGPLAEQPTPEEKQIDVKDLKENTNHQLPVGVCCVLLSLTMGAAGLTLAMRDANADPKLQTVMSGFLAVASSIGLIVALMGFSLLIVWRDKLFQWILEDKSGESRPVLIAGIVFLLGMLWSFLVLQLGRGQERRNAVIRRVIYGFNSLFVSVLLAVIILVVNTIFFYQFPTPFVTNETAFQGLSEPTQKYLEKLETPIQIYMILSSNEEVEIQSRYGPYVYSNLYSDMRGLLSQCAELNKNIKVEYLSPGIDVTRVNLVLEEFRRSNVENEKQLGIYLAVGEGGARKSIVSIQDVMSLAQPRPGSQPFPVFVGETVLMSEIAYLVDGRENEKIYFTQAHGELGMEAKQDDPHTMAEVIKALRAEKIQVEPLKLDEKDPKVPDDAAVVVVAGPRQTITNDSPTYKALEDYLKRRNGRLLAFLPAIKGVDQRVSPTGLEPLLGGFGVDLSPDTRLIVSPPGYILGERFKLPGNMIIAEWDKRFREPVAAIYNQIPIFGIDSRRVAPMANEGPFLVQSVYNTVPISRGGIWQEASYESSIQTVWEQMLQQGQPILEAKRFTMEPVSVAVAVSDRPATQEAKPIPRMVVFGSDLMLLDNSQIGRFVGPEKQAALVSQSIDWLRQRNINLGIPLKKPNSYQLPTGTEKSTYLYLLLLATVIIGGGGLSVWYLRQK